MAEADQSAMTPLCHRCGYDQSGQVATWTESCPLDGTCAECGLALRWAEVMQPDRWQLRGFFEHDVRHPSRAVLVTYSRLVTPHRFWRWVRMEHAVNWARLSRFVLIGAIISHLLVVGAVVVLTACLGDLARLWKHLPSAWIPDWRSWRVDETVARVLCPYWDAPHHYAVRLEEWVVFLAVWTVLLPLTFACLPITLRRAKVRASHVVRIAAYSLAVLPLGAAAFSVLPALLATIGVWPGSRWKLHYDTDSATMLGLAVSAAMLWCWWWSAVRWYLRLPHAAVTCTALLIVAGMLASVLCLIPRGLRLDLIELFI